MNALVPDFVTDTVEEYQKKGSKNIANDMMELYEVANHMRSLIEEKEKDLIELKRTLQSIECGDMVDILQEAGVLEVVGVNGHKFKMQHLISASINKDDYHAAIDWIESVGYADIVTNNIEASVKGDPGTQTEIESALDDIGASYAVTRKIHPSTLKAAARRMVEEGIDINDDYLKVSFFNKVKCT